LNGWHNSRRAQGWPQHRLLTNHYGANGRVDDQTLADPNAAYSFAYMLDQAGTSVTRTDVTDPRNHTKRLTFNPHHDLIEQIDGFGAPEAPTTTIARQTTPSALIWEANQAFLDEVVARGDVMSTSIDNIRAGSTLAREIDYLLSNGYQIAANGTTLIK